MFPSGQQMQTRFVGTIPGIYIEPEPDLENDLVRVIITAVDMGPRGVIQMADLMKESALLIIAEEEKANADLRAASDEFDASLKD